MKPYILLFFLALSSWLFAQNDTLIINNNYKFKVGVKGMVEESYLNFLSNKNYNFGGQLIYKIGKTKSSLESGIYYYSRNTFETINPRYTVVVFFKELHIPLKYRLDIKGFYFSAGLFGEYFLHTKTEDHVQKQVNSKFKEFKVGLTTSFGFEKPLTSQINVFVEGRYSNVFTTDFSLPNIGIGIGFNYKILKN